MIDLKAIESLVLEYLSSYFKEPIPMNFHLSCIIEEYAFMNRKSEDPDINQKIFEKVRKEILNFEEYDPEHLYYRQDHNNDMTSYGWVMTPDGKIYHLLNQYCHGLVMASLYPKECLLLGYIPPCMDKSRNVLSVYDYQDFQFRVDNEISFITYSETYKNRVSWDHKSVTEAQLKSLKAWLSKNVEMDDVVDTDYCHDITFKKLLIDVDKAVNERKMGNTSPVDYQLIDPNESENLNDF